MSRTAAVASLATELSQRTGMRAHEGHADRLQRVLRHHLAHDDAGAPDLGDATLLDALIDTVSIDETYFFRHRDQLAFLRTQIFPRILAERGDDHVLQIWGAGCANGAEPYTLAMILDEEGLGSRSSVLGTDLTVAALDRARAAIYTRWSLRSPEIASRLDRFDPTGRGQHRLEAAVRQQVRFQQHNLMDADYPRPPVGDGFDVILCRNVLLHLTPAAIAVVVPRLVDALAPGGWLLTAPADPPVNDVAGAEGLDAVIVPAGGVVYRRRPRPMAHEQPTTAPATAAPPPGRRSSRGSQSSQRVATRLRRHQPPRPAARVPAAQPATGATDARDRCLRARELLATGRATEAVSEAMGAVFLDPELAAAQLTLGIAATAAGQRIVAARAFRHAVTLMAALPPGTAVELCDGETAGSLADLARAHALLLGEQPS
jgi:chemotaxis protein methyltransferase CheR